VCGWEGRRACCAGWPGVNVEQYCTISPASVIPPNARIPDFTVVHSGAEQRLDKTLLLRPEILDAKLAVHAKQLAMFKKLIPNNVAKWAV
jgi:dynactin-6